MPDPPPFDRFGFFLTKNATREEDLGLYTMYTGEGDPYKLATIAAYNGNTNLGRLLA
jgi:CD36 family